jgi:hypothetical protein
MQAFTSVAQSFATLMLREGISSPEAERLLRSVFVHAAASATVNGEARPNVSRVSLLTGVDRHVAAGILKAPPGENADRETRRHRLNRVLAEWYADPDYSSASRPKDLEIRGSPNRRTFWTLSQTYAKGDYPGLLLNELINVGAVTRLPDGRVRARMRSYKTSEWSEDSVDEIAQRLRDLAHTLFTNLSEPDAKRVCETVQTIDVDEEDLVLIRRSLQQRSAAAATGLGNLLNSPRWRANGKSGRRVRIGWTCFSFEERLVEDSKSESKKKRSRSQLQRERPAVKPQRSRVQK